MLDEKRQLQGRNACCFCIKYDEETTKSALETHLGETNAQTPASEEEEKELKWYNKISVHYIVTHHVVWLLSKRIYRLIIIFVFCGLFALSLVSLQWLNTDSDISRFVPDDSYVLDYLHEYDNAYGRTLTPMWLIVLDEDFSDPTVRDNMYNMFNDFNTFEDGDVFFS